MPRPKSGFVAEHGETIRNLYVNEDYSMKQIVEYFSERGVQVNTQRIWRALKELRVERRSASESQKNALATGRATHPTAGKPLSESNRQNLSKSIGKRWSEVSDEERARRAAKARENYANMSDRKKKQLHHKAAVAVRKAAEQGSKLELFLVDKLEQSGYNVVFHKKGYIINDNLEIDILLPANKIAIEVDGVYHTEDVFGDLPKVINKDHEKNGLLLNMGYIVIRLSNTAKTCSLYYMEKKWSQLNTVLEKIKNEFPPADQRLIYLLEEK